MAVSLFSLLNATFVGIMLAAILFGMAFIFLAINLGTHFLLSLIGGYVLLTCANIFLLINKRNIPKLYLYFTIAMFVAASIWISVAVYEAELRLVDLQINPDDPALIAVRPGALAASLSVINIMLSSGLLVSAKIVDCLFSTLTGMARYIAASLSGIATR